MKSRTTLQLALIAVILGSGIYLLDNQIDHRQTQKLQVKRVFDVNTDPITVIGIEEDAQRIEFVRKDKLWFIQKPLRARAEGARVEALAAALERLRWDDYITVEQREQRGRSLADYGLDPATRRIFMETNGGRVEILHLGDPGPFGKTVYGRMDRNDAVLILPESVMRLRIRDLSYWRDRLLVDGTPPKTERIDLYRRDFGFVQLVRQKGEWVLQQPLVAKADSVVVRQLLEALFALRISTFHWDAPAEEPGEEADEARREMDWKGQMESAGLSADAARLRCQLWIEGDRLGQEILFGQDVKDTAPPGIYVRKAGSMAIYTVPSAIVDTCSMPVDALRDRAVFNFAAGDVRFLRLEHNDNRVELQRTNGTWRLQVPVQATADTEAVSALIGRLLALRVDEYLPMDSSTTPVLPPPDCIRVTLSPQPVDPSTPRSTTLSPREVTLYVQEHAEPGQPSFVISQGRSDVFTLPVDAVAGFDQSLVSPLRFRSPVMLTVSNAAVMRLTLADHRTSTTQRVERAADKPGTWRDSRTEASLPINAAAVQDLLAATERIEASRFAAFMPHDLAPYGLAVPSTTLTIMLRGEVGLQNTLMLGNPADNDGVYAMVKGHDVVFVLPTATAERLRQPLFETAASTVPPPMAPLPAVAEPEERRPVDNNSSTSTPATATGI